MVALKAFLIHPDVTGFRQGSIRHARTRRITCDDSRLPWEATLLLGGSTSAIKLKPRVAECGGSYAYGIHSFSAADRDRACVGANAELNRCRGPSGGPGRNGHW
jgi:hypothetical protein